VTDEDRETITAHLRTHRWIVAPRLTDQLAEIGYRAVLSERQLRTILKKPLYIAVRGEHGQSTNQPGDQK